MLDTIVCIYNVVVIIPVTYLFISAVTQSISPDTVVAQQNAVVRNVFFFNFFDPIKDVLYS